MEKVIIVSGPVIVKDGKVLLDISGEDDFWKFCGGKVEEKENLREAAARRVKEELGIDIRIVNEQPFIMAVPKPNEEGKDVFLVHYLSEAKGEIRPREMVKEWAWLDIKNLPSNLAPNIMPALKYFKLIDN
jgi:ADP-ribose pyrophosphatase YjhB (NUDIX family)